MNFYPVPQTYTASIRTLDNLGRTLIGNENLLDDFRSRNYRISYAVEVTDKAFIADNDVKCLFSNADFSVADPFDQDCNAPVYRNYNSLVGEEAISYSCQCDKLMNKQNALAFTTNVSRPYVCPGDPRCIPEPPVIIDPNFPLDRDHSYLILLTIVVPFLMFGLVFPGLMIYLDRRDYRKINEGANKISEK